MPSDPDLTRLAHEAAPLLRLHPDEEFWPISPDDFLAACRLELVRKLSSGFQRTAVFDHGAREWDTAPQPFQHFGLPAALLESWQLLHVDPPDADWTRRPHDRVRPPDQHLFALQHRSREPVEPFDPADPPPAYHFIEPRGDDIWISYWFFYGFSRFLLRWGHQGDWEHVRLRIRDGRVAEALFAVHEIMYRVPRDLLTFDGHRLVVYSAKNRHATWWKPGAHLPLALFRDEVTWGEVLSDRDRALLQDETSDDGPTWDTRLDLRPLETQPWRHYAGAWGRLGNDASTTGPLGPWQKRFIPPDRPIIEE